MGLKPKHPHSPLLALIVVLIGLIAVASIGSGWHARKNSVRQQWLFGANPTQLKRIEFVGQQRRIVVAERSALESFERSVHGLQPGTGRGGISYAVILTLHNDQKLDLEISVEKGRRTIGVAVNEYLLDDPDYFHADLPDTEEWKKIVEQL